MRWRVATAALSFTVAAWGQTAPAPSCQWGNCANRCQETCQPGYVCGVEGRCVLVAQLTPAAEAREAQRVAAEAKQAEQENAVNAQHRKRARFWTRYSLGGGMGIVNLRRSYGQAIPISLNLGLRQQLSELGGLHLQLIGMAAKTDARVDSVVNGAIARRSLGFGEIGASMVPYFGPFGRFYAGPCLFIGYRWYTTMPLQDGIAALNVENILLREGGVRLGVLLGSEEQVDLTAMLTSSFDKDTPSRLLFSASFEFR